MTHAGFRHGILLAATTAMPLLSGCASAQTTQAGAYDFNKRFGPYDVDRVVPIASASKWLSAGVIMSLVADRKLSLDDRVGKFFPDIPGKKAEITVGQLFSHTSGITGAEPCIVSRSRWVSRAPSTRPSARRPIRESPAGWSPPRPSTRGFSR